MTLDRSDWEHVLERLAKLEVENRRIRRRLRFVAIGLPLAAVAAWTVAPATSQDEDELRRKRIVTEEIVADRIKVGSLASQYIRSEKEIKVGKEGDDAPQMTLWPKTLIVSNKGIFVALGEQDGRPFIDVQEKTGLRNLYPLKYPFK